LAGTFTEKFLEAGEESVLLAASVAFTLKV
jgi:hypothetical protein